jgi:hypothetical protein
MLKIFAVIVLIVSGQVKQCWIGVHDSYANPITLTMMDLSEVSLTVIELTDLGLEHLKPFQTIRTASTPSKLHDKLLGGESFPDGTLRLEVLHNSFSNFNAVAFNVVDSLETRLGA